MEIVNTTEELYKRDSKGKIRFYRGEVGQENGKYYKRAVTLSLIHISEPTRPY